MGRVEQGGRRSSTDPARHRRRAGGALAAGSFACLLALPAPAVGQSGVADPEAPSTARWVRWAWQRTDLVRYNRIEGLSLGVRAQAYPGTPAGPVTVGATARMGTADRRPDVRLDLIHESLERRLALGVFHELGGVDEGAGHLGLANSATSLLLGRDDGDYYRRTGVALAWTPPTARARSFHVRVLAERHRAADVSTDFALAHAVADGWRFRSNLAADEGWDVGAALTLSPWWGTDPQRPRAGLEGALRVGAGTWSYRSAALTGRVLLPLAERGRLEVVAGGGSAWGAPPAQRRFAVGGPATLRGLDPYALSGAAFLRGRVGLSRQWPFGVLSAFSDAAWAGERSAFALEHVVASAGFGVALADGRIHADAAWAVRGASGFRLEVYLDATP